MRTTHRTDPAALVLEGDLREWSIFSVLQLVSGSRRYTAVELRDVRGAVIGTVYIRCGDVVAVEYGGATGEDAVIALLCEASESFAVFRLPEPTQTLEVVAPLREILFRLAERPTMERLQADACVATPNAKRAGRTTYIA